MTDNRDSILDGLMYLVNKQEAEVSNESPRFVFVDEPGQNAPPSFVLGDKERLAAELFIAAEVVNRILDIGSPSMNLFGVDSPRPPFVITSRSELNVIARALKAFMTNHAKELVQKHDVETVDRETFEKMRKEILKDK
jgi:hypothetical protein